MNWLLYGADLAMFKFLKWGCTVIPLMWGGQVFFGVHFVNPRWHEAYAVLGNILNLSEYRNDGVVVDIHSALIRINDSWYGFVNVGGGKWNISIMTGVITAGFIGIHLDAVFNWSKPSWFVSNGERGYEPELLAKGAAVLIAMLIAGTVLFFAVASD